jgi:hypothetical protein
MWEIVSESPVFMNPHENIPDINCVELFVAFAGCLSRKADELQHDMH